SGGLSVDLNYTFSKNIDGSSRFEDSFQIPWQNMRIEKALSAFDIRHVFSSAALFELPFGNGKRFANSGRVLPWILGGFQINAAVQAQSGEPLTITQTNTNLLLSAQRPNVVN